MYLCVMKDVHFERLFFWWFRPKIYAYLKICVAIEGSGNADILLTQCHEKRRKQAYIYAKIRTGSVQNCLPKCLINHQVNISDLTM